MKAILFDLDGTLLPMNTQAFMASYKESLENHFKDLHPEEGLFERVMTCVGKMVKDTRVIPNQEKFFTYFFHGLPVNQQAYIDHFQAFYLKDFVRVKDSTDQSQAIIEAVDLLKDKGYKLIIATNPIFPMIANKERIKWAGLNIKDFDYVSSFEDNTACKPFPAFYEEVLRRNNLEASEVLMVGNDAQEDLSIRTLGVKTYLIDNHLINREKDLPYTDYISDYEGFKAFVKTLPRVEV